MHLGQINHDKHVGGDDPSSFIIEQLKLDADQQKQFDELKHQHQDFAKNMHEEEKKLHDAYFALLKTDNPDKTKVDSIASLMAAKQKEMELFTFDHFQKLKAICRDDQKKLFDQTIDEIAKQVGGPAPHPDGPPPPRP
jgi:protein CpxP